MNSIQAHSDDLGFDSEGIHLMASIKYWALLDEASKSAWCRAQGVYPQDLEGWSQSATAALSDPGAQQAEPKQAQQDKRRIKELERELLRKERALAETAALLVLPKKVAVIFNRGEDE